MFPPARTASILALAATQQYFLLQEVANRILPALCPLTTDVDKGVRDNAFRTIRGFLSKLERVSEDPGLRESMGTPYTVQSSCKREAVLFFMRAILFQRQM